MEVFIRTDGRRQKMMIAASEEMCSSMLVVISYEGSRVMKELGHATL